MKTGTAKRKSRASTGKKLSSSSQKFTLVGRYDNEDQNFVEWISGRDWGTALDTFRGRMEDNNLDEGVNWEIVAGFKGHLVSLV